MTSRDRLTAIHLITEFLHDELCAFDASPGTEWSEAHMRVDRGRAGRLCERLVAARVIVEPRPGVLDADFLAVP